MKKIMTLAIAAFIALTASAKIEKTSEFKTVKVDAPVHLVILKGHDYTVNMMSRNSELTHAVSYKVKDGKLYLSARDLESLEKSNGRVTVIITAPGDVDYQIASDMKKVPNRRPRLFRR